MNKNSVLIIIGGGASGIIAGIFAKRILKDKANVIILERMQRIGKKILATGNGLCNFTNINTDIQNFHGKNPYFVKCALQNFNVYDTLNFFESIGIYPKEEKFGKMYPYSGQASSILDVLRNEIQRLGVEIITDFEVREVKKLKSGFKIVSFSEKSIYANKVIIAAGGCASPSLGSNGTGFKILKSLGHNITKLTPALVQVKTKRDIVKGLKGIKFNGNVKIISNNKILGEQEGEVLFTDYGLSGPPIFQLSLISALNDKCTFLIDFIPSLSQKDVFDLLCQRMKNLSHLTMESFFIGMLNKKIGSVIIKNSKIQKLSFPVSSLSKELIWNMTKLIKEMPFDIIGNNGWNNAQVTAGGVFTSEFNSETLESKKVSGIYASGEVFDIFGDCGGFNLQWAWSSGVLAGKSASEAILAV